MKWRASSKERASQVPDIDPTLIEPVSLYLARAHKLRAMSHSARTVAIAQKRAFGCGAITVIIRERKGIVQNHCRGPSLTEQKFFECKAREDGKLFLGTAT
jgi:hypothetical protein